VDVPYIPLIESKKKDLKDLRIAWTDDFGGVPVTGDAKDCTEAIRRQVIPSGMQS